MSHLDPDELADRYPEGAHGRERRAEREAERNLQKSEGNAALADADIVDRLRESDNDTEFVSAIGHEKRLTLAWEAAETIELLRLRLDHSDAQSEQLAEALVVVAAAKNLVAQKGRHNTETAYRRLADALTHNAE